ncbi:MAG: DUF1572 family protein, partial [Ignavibacteriaceae bacterium]
MFGESIVEIFGRDLNKLRIEISSYTDETKLWTVEKNIKNSGGNLCLHLIGNLKQFIGSALGKKPYERNRDAEFGLNNISKKELLKEINGTMELVAETINSLKEDDFIKIYPVDVFNKPMTTEFFLISLIA